MTIKIPSTFDLWIFCFLEIYHIFWIIPGTRLLHKSLGWKIKTGKWALYGTLKYVLNFRIASVCRWFGPNIAPLLSAAARPRGDVLFSPLACNVMNNLWAFMSYLLQLFILARGDTCVHMTLQYSHRSRCASVAGCVPPPDGVLSRAAPTVIGAGPGFMQTRFKSANNP